MEKKKKSLLKRIIIITISVLLGILILALAFVGFVSLKSGLRNNSDPLTITNDTEYVIANKSSLYDKDGKQLRLKGANVGQALVYEGWISPFSVGASVNADGSLSRDNDGNSQYPEMTTDEAIEGFRSNPNLTDVQRRELNQIYLNHWFTEEDFKTCKEELKFNALRLPFTWRNILNDDYSLKEEEEAFAYLDWFMGECSKYQIYCILDLHNAPKGQNGYEHGGTWTNDLWKDEKAIQATCDLWSYVAKHYLTSKPELGKWIATFDILNEPCGTSKGETMDICYPVFDKIYQAIRKVDDKHNITIEYCWDQSKFIPLERYGWKNVQYEFHMYNWGHVSYWLFNDYFELKSWFHNYEVPLFIGEFSFWDSKDDWFSQLGMFDKRGYSWTMWTYKKTVVGWWNDSWGLKNLKLNLKPNTDEVKVNLKTASYEEIKALFEKVDSANCENSNTFETVKEYMNQ